MVTKITDTIYYIGENDHDIDLFEGQYVVPNGMAYNSYVILDQKIAVMDTIDRSKTAQWLDNLSQALQDRCPDYLVVQHMEPDHAASIGAFMEKYPETTVIGNAKTFTMIGQFFPGLILNNTLTVKSGDTLSLGSHNLQFLFAPMVHWPEVMLTYESSEKILFSADAFGKFGALDADEHWDCEARRYYIGIVGKYGKQVQNVLKAASSLDIATICPLHGPVLSDDLAHYLHLYDLWSSYTPESQGVFIAYTSVYGHTKEAVELLASTLEARGVTVNAADLARDDMAEAVEDAFRYDRLVLATTTYNGDIFPFMKTYLDALTERNYQNRTVGFIENGSWAPTATKVMKGLLEKSKNLTYTEAGVKIISAVSECNLDEIDALAKELCLSYAK